MADFDTKLRWLSERGKPVGAEELIERIEAELAGDPLVVVAKRREGTLMTKTQQSPTTRPPSQYRGLAWAVAAFVAVLAVAGLYLAFGGGNDEVADTTPDTETMTDLEIIEAGVDALYTGDAERAVELFESPRRPRVWDDDWIRDEVAYQAAIEGRVTVDCKEDNTPGAVLDVLHDPRVFTCTWLYHNAITDAIGYVESSRDTFRVVVADGVIAEFSEFPFHGSQHLDPIMGGLRAFLGEKVDEPPDNSDSLCSFGYPWTMRGSLSLQCVDFVLDHLDEWAAWAETNRVGFECGLWGGPVTDSCGKTSVYGR